MMDAKKSGLAVAVLGGLGALIFFGTRSDAQANALPGDGSIPGNLPTPPDQTVPLPSMSDPSRGDATVQLYQQRLADLGYDPGPIDGRYGSLTRRAVQDFQRDNSLNVDGVLGPRTKAALDAAAGATATAGLPTARRWWKV